MFLLWWLLGIIVVVGGLCAIITVIVLLVSIFERITKHWGFRTISFADTLLGLFVFCFVTFLIVCSGYELAVWWTT